MTVKTGRHKLSSPTYISILSAILISSVNLSAQTPETDVPKTGPDPAPLSHTQTPAQYTGGWKVCNETSFIIRLATAALRGGKMTPEGWTRLRSGDCTDVDAPAGSPRYVFAESDPVHLGGIREWKGEIPLCADTEDFSANATIDCALQDMESRNFFQVDPAELTTTLIEPDNFGARSVNAGIQRLLRDNGYRVSRIDGLMGRRTSRTLRNFLKTKDKPRTISDTEKIDLLAKAANTLQDSIGLTFCNRTQSKIWTALAFRDEGRWESRGWWPVTIGECLRPFTESLKGSDAHFYALQEQELDETGPRPDKHLRNITPKPSQFCIAESRFASIGRDYCSDRGYVPANFRPVPTDKDGQQVLLTESDFSEPSTLGLRR